MKEKLKNLGTYLESYTNQTNNPKEGYVLTDYSNGCYVEDYYEIHNLLWSVSLALHGYEECAMKKGGFTSSDFRSLLELLVDGKTDIPPRLQKVLDFLEAEEKKAIIEHKKFMENLKTLKDDDLPF